MAKPRYPIYIPSKGRSDCCRTAHLLNRNECEFKLVVEPQDIDSYTKKFGASYVLALPEDNPGHVSYSRNWIKQHAHEAGAVRHWQLDDDINRFMFYTNNRRSCQPADTILQSMEQFADQYKNVAVCGPMYSTWAAMARKPFSVNRLCASAFLISDDDQFVWRRVIEDVDYCLQVLAAGFCTVLFHAFAMDVVSPVADSVAYSMSEKRMDAIRRLRSLWPKLDIRIKKTGTQLDCSRVWRKFTTPLERRG